MHNPNTFAQLMADEGMVSVAMRQDKGGSSDPGGRYNYVRGSAPTHHYRCVLPNEVAFDLGDHGDWGRTVRETTALWMGLNRMGIPYWGALSGGDGTHTHVLGPKQADNSWRAAAAGAILDVANEYYMRMVGKVDFIESDWRLLAPAPETRLVREFGARKTMGSKHPKMIWTEGPGPFVPLPKNRDRAYEMAAGFARIYPSQLRRCDWLPHLDRSWMKDIAPRIVCPQGPHCQPGHPEYEPDFMAGCKSCPFPEALSA